jgi:hypothetical protein
VRSIHRVVNLSSSKHNKKEETDPKRRENWDYDTIYRLIEMVKKNGKGNWSKVWI